MKLIRISDEIKTAVEQIRYQAEKIKDCCLVGRKPKYRVKRKMCARCEQRVLSILNRLR